MNLEKQKLLLRYILSNSDVFVIASPVIKSSYFDPELRKVVAFVQDYYETYHSTPDFDQINSEFPQLQIQPTEISGHKIQYCTTEIETFCKQKAIEEAILSSASLLEKQQYGEIEKVIKEAVTLSLQTDLGMRYFEDPESRLKSMLSQAPVIPTGWTDVDYILNGGITRKQLIMYTANTGGGKSLTLANASVNYLYQGLNVLYLSLELYEDLIAMRFDSMFSGVSNRDWRDNIEKIVKSVNSATGKCGSLNIKYMPSGTNSNSIRSYIKEYVLHYGYAPDVLVVDYLDLMGTNEYVNKSDVFTKDKLASEELRNLGSEFDMILATASQQNREAYKAGEASEQHIAGGMSKANTCDVWISIVWNELLKAQGKMIFKFLKTRSSDGVGKKVPLDFNRTSLRITNCTDDDMKQEFSSEDIPAATHRKNKTDVVGSGNSSEDLLNLIEGLSQG